MNCKEAEQEKERWMVTFPSESTGAGDLQLRFAVNETFMHFKGILKEKAQNPWHHLDLHWLIILYYIYTVSTL